MQELKENIYIEDKYPGVTLGAINTPRGLIYIDAPPLPEDGRFWRADLLGLDSGPERLLINLDSNADRTLGARAMDCTVLAHENTAKFFRSRPSAFKTQGQTTGAEWEIIPGLSNIRWALPNLSFTDQVTLHWGDTPIHLEHHYGADIGAIWVILPVEKIVFVGDTILKNQPPFLAQANLPAWIEELETLLSEEYKGYMVVSGRGGVCASSTLKKQLSSLRKTHTKMEQLAARQVDPDATEKIIPSLLSPLRFLAANRERYAQRLRHGLAQYYTRHYIPEDADND